MIACNHSYRGIYGIYHPYKPEFSVEACGSCHAALYKKPVDLEDTTLFNVTSTYSFSLLEDVTVCDTLKCRYS